MKLPNFVTHTNASFENTKLTKKSLLCLRHSSMANGGQAVNSADRFCGFVDICEAGEAC